MSFQEQPHPLTEILQHAIDGLKSDINDREFEAVLQQIDGCFPFVDLSEFLEMYVDGEYSKVLIKMFHLSGYAEYQKLLQILKLPQKRRSIQKTPQSREINMQNKKLAERYECLQEILSRFLPTIKNRIKYNVLRSIILFHLYSNMYNFTTKKAIAYSIPTAITDFEHLVTAPHMPLSIHDSRDLNMQVNSILDGLQERNFLESGDSDRFRLREHQLKIHDYILNTIRNREGITHQDLLSVIKNKIVILSQMPPTLIQIVLHELTSDNSIIKKEGYWKLKPSYDEYFTFEYYKRVTLENSRISGKRQGFCGRKIMPDDFIRELRLLDRGDFEDHDDQVTRIAGMILANSPMMAHPPNELKEFDFVVDLSNYTFTGEQQDTIQNLGIEIRSDITYVKVMTNADITIDELSDLVLKLKKRGHNEQGFIISFAVVDSRVKKMLEHDKTIQLISVNELKQWCKITPIIPSRRGAVAVVRQGRNSGAIAKIKSVNYESGMADVVLLTGMRNCTQYIGSLEEITLDVPLTQFIDHSSKYFEFLRKLHQISKDDVFMSVVADGPAGQSSTQSTSYVEILPYQIKCEFCGHSKTSIDFEEGGTDKQTLDYLTRDLFSCTCFVWIHQSRTHGLCEHLVFLLNESVKRLLSTNIRLSHEEIECTLIEIEERMNLFLRRLKYSSHDGSYAVCPKCDCVAETIGQVESLFGYRQMDKSNKFSLRRQSRCKRCRR